MQEGVQSRFPFIGKLTFKNSCRLPFLGFYCLGYTCRYFMINGKLVNKTILASQFPKNWYAEELCLTALSSKLQSNHHTRATRDASVHRQKHRVQAHSFFKPRMLHHTQVTSAIYTPHDIQNKLISFRLMFLSMLIQKQHTQKDNRECSDDLYPPFLLLSLNYVFYISNQRRTI